MTTLRQVLRFFEEADGPLSMSQAAQALVITPGMLEGMIAHWVRKGRLREVIDCGEGCATCGGATCGRGQGCPFIPASAPRRYELATGAILQPRPVTPAHSCPHCG